MQEFETSEKVCPLQRMLKEGREGGMGGGGGKANLKAVAPIQEDRQGDLGVRVCLNGLVDGDVGPGDGHLAHGLAHLGGQRIPGCHKVGGCLHSGLLFNAWRYCSWLVSLRGCQWGMTSYNCLPAEAKHNMSGRLFARHQSTNSSLFVALNSSLT